MQKPLLFARREPFGYLFYNIKTDRVYTLKTNTELDFNENVLLNDGLTEIYYPTGTIKLLPSKIIHKDILSGPTSVDLYTTLFCNERCEFCYIGDRLNNYVPGLGRDNAIRISDQILANGVFEVSIVGGEPLLYKDLGWLLEHLHGYGFKLSLSSNGAVNDKEIIKKIHKCEVSFTLSFHSHIPEIHSSIVGNPAAFSKEVEMLRYVLKEGMWLHITILVTRSNYSTLINTIKFLINEGVKSITLFHSGKSGFALANPEKSVDFWEYKKLFEKALEVGKEHNVKITSRTNFPFLVLDDFKFDNDKELANFMYGAMDTRRILHILYDGSTYSTTYNLPNNIAYLGNMLMTSLNEIWTNNKNMESLRKATVPVACNNCKHLMYCRGGSVINYCTSGKSKNVPECPVYTIPLLVE